MSEQRRVWEPKSLEESEASRADFGSITWHLLGVANVDRRDVVAHSDRVRYTAIGMFMLFFSLYAFGGWMAFLSTAGIRRLGSGSLAAEIAGALLGTAAVLTFDRALVGLTKPNLEYRLPNSQEEIRPDDGVTEDLDDQTAKGHPASADIQSAVAPIPSLVAGRNRGAIFGRVLVAFIIGAVVTQAADLAIFAGDIDLRRAKEQIRPLESQLNKLEASHKTDVANHKTAENTASKNIAQATDTERHAESYSHGHCRMYRMPLSNPPQKSVCEVARELAQQATREKTQLEENDPSNATSPSGLRFSSARASFAQRIEDLHTHPSHSRSAGGSLSANTTDLFQVISGNVESLVLYIAVLILALLLDLAAILFKVTGFGSEYEQRQALRRWIAHTGATVAERRKLTEQQFELRREHREAEVRTAAAEQAATTEIQRNAAEQREYRAALANAHEAAMTELDVELAAQRAIRTATGQADQDPDVINDARYSAAKQAQERIRTQTPALTAFPQPPPPQQESTPEPERPAASDTSSPGYQAGEMVTGKRVWRLLEQMELQGRQSRVWKACSTDGGSLLAAIKFMSVGRRGPHEAPSFDPKTERARNDLNWLQDFPPDSRHLPQLLDYGGDQQGRGLWHATALAPLGTLHDHYLPHDARPRRLAEILHFGRQIIVGLEEARRATRHDVVHGDIKPDNLLLFDTVSGITGPEVPRLVIADWGLAQTYGNAPGIGGHQIATVEFAARQAFDEGEGVSVLDDLFSIGAVIWWCITGRPPGTESYARPEPGAKEEILEEYRCNILSARENLDPLHLVYRSVPDYVEQFVMQLLNDSRPARMPQLETTIQSPKEILTEAWNQINNVLNVLVQSEQRAGVPITVYLEPQVGPKRSLRGTGSAHHGTVDGGRPPTADRSPSAEPAATPPDGVPLVNMRPPSDSNTDKDTADNPPFRIGTGPSRWEKEIPDSTLSRESSHRGDDRASTPLLARGDPQRRNGRLGWLARLVNPERPGRL